MSHPDGKSNGSGFKKTGKGRDRRGRSGPGNKGGPKTTSKSLNSDEAVPMLKYGPYKQLHHLQGAPQDCLHGEVW
jgi:hypothetical protein